VQTASDEPRTPAAARGIALTFDDGPEADGTPAVLGALRDAGASATFFVIGPRAETHPELIAQIAAEGHEVAVHCDEHIKHSERDRDWVATDLRRACGRLERLGVSPVRWRTPYGDQAPWTSELAREAGLELVGWSADTHDWRGDEADLMFEATCAELRPGAIVLAHDGIGPGALRSDVTETVRYVALAARHASDRGLPLTRLG
jgi:peptidoglycan/xylan/chitin deacetylase (PgdA/CDA1 family)